MLKAAPGAIALFLGLLFVPRQSRAEPLAKPVVGPAAICFKYSAFTLLAGERITDFDASVEGMRIGVEGPKGSYSIAESEIFARQTAGKTLVLKQDRTRVYRVPAARPRYAIYGPTSFSDGVDQLIIWLSGGALKGTAIDANIYRRIQVRDPASAKCEKMFTYGWFLDR